MTYAYEKLEASYTKAGDNYLPRLLETKINGAIVEHVDYGQPLATKATALKYAQLWLNACNKVRRIVTTY